MSLRAPGAGAAMRSFRQDESVAQHRLAPGTLRRVLGFARPYRLELAGFLGLILLSAALGAASPLVYKAIIDQGVVAGNARVVVALAAVLGLLAVVSGGVGLAQRWLGSRIGEGLVRDLRTEVFDHVQAQPVAFFSRTQTGALISRLDNDIQGAQQAFTSTLSNVVGNAVTLVFTVTAMAALSWQLTLAALLLVPVFVLPARRMGRRLSAITRERYQTAAAMNQRISERVNVSGAVLVKLFGDPRRESAEFAAQADRVRELGIRSSVYAGVFATALMLVASLATALIYGAGGVMAVAGSLGVGTLVALTAYLNRLFGPITALSNVQVDVMTALVAFERVLEILDLEPLVADAPDAVDLPAGPAAVELDHISFGYPAAAKVSLSSLEGASGAPLSVADGDPVLTDVSLAVPAGATLALVGASGAGKSTIASLVTRLHDVSSGSVRVAGVDVRDVTQRSLRAAVGVVSQDAHLFHDTLRANLAYADPEATEAQLWEALEQARIADLVASLPDGLDTVVGDRGYRMSGGEKQRLAIARVLLKAPAVVILDEATAHLDAESEAAVQQALATALAGRTCLVIAHRLATVRDADEIAVVQDGRIVERGTHDELLARSGVYADLVRTQLAGGPPDVGLAA